MRSFAIFLSLVIVTSCQAPNSMATYSSSRSVENKSVARQQASFLHWAEKKQDEIRDIDWNNATEKQKFEVPVYLEIQPRVIQPPTAEEAARMRAASELYYELVGYDTLQSLLWTGIESANPLTRHEEYRWNSLKDQGLYEPEKRRVFIEQLKKLGIRNIRLGLSNHEIDVADEKTWKTSDDIIGDVASAGIKISLDLHHFGIEDRFRVADRAGKTVHEKSYYLNPDWPAYFAEFAARAMQRYNGKIQAFTIMNEPETVIGFNLEMWHGAYPGWGHPQENRVYVARSVQVAKAAVMARLRIEELLAKLPAPTRPKIMYMHTEASVYKPYWEDFNLYRRFIISDMILGHPWLVEGDIEGLARWPMKEIDGRWHRLTRETRTNFDWVVENYVIFNQPAKIRESRRKELVRMLTELRDLHHTLQSRFGKSMRTDTVLAVDYYSHNEDKGKDGNRLDPEPQYYADQIKSGNRAGLYNVIVDYYNHFQMPVMIGESGTPYYFYGAKWNQQMLLECAQAAAQGIPFLGYTIYPALDTWGWETALSVPKDKALYNPSGIVTPEMQPRPFMNTLLNSLEEHVPKR